MQVMGEHTKCASLVIYVYIATFKLFTSPVNFSYYIENVLQRNSSHNISQLRCKYFVLSQNFTFRHTNVVYAHENFTIPYEIGKDHKKHILEGINLEPFCYGSHQSWGVIEIT